MFSTAAYLVRADMDLCTSRGGQTVIFAVLKTRYILLLHSVINW